MNKKIVLFIVLTAAMTTLMAVFGTMIANDWESNEPDMKIKSETAVEQNIGDESALPGDYIEHHRAPTKQLH